MNRSDESPASHFQDLTVWQSAHTFVLEAYRATNQFPSDERFGLISQFRRAAVSIPANIAEGFRLRGVSDKLRFFNIAESSLEECRYYIILARDLEFSFDHSALRAIADEVAGLLFSYSAAIRRNRRH